MQTNDNVVAYRSNAQARLRHATTRRAAPTSTATRT